MKAELMSERVRLSRTLKPANVWAIALGTIIGWGCFILPGGWLHGSGPLGAALGLILGAAMMFWAYRHDDRPAPARK